MSANPLMVPGGEDKRQFIFVPGILRYNLRTHDTEDELDWIDPHFILDFDPLQKTQFLDYSSLNAARFGHILNPA